jgi:putative membrane protein
MEDETTHMEVSAVLALGHGWGAGPWFLLFPLFWLTVIVALALVFRRRPWGGSHDASGEALLGERYARGEISEEEYRQRLSVLRRGSR